MCLLTSFIVMDYRWFGWTPVKTVILSARCLCVSMDHAVKKMYRYVDWMQCFKLTSYCRRIRSPNTSWSSARLKYTKESWLSLCSTIIWPQHQLFWGHLRTDKALLRNIQRHHKISHQDLWSPCELECMLSLMKNGGIPKNKKDILEFMTISFKTSNISLKLLTW